MRCEIFNRIHGRSGWKERFLVFCASINLSNPIYFFSRATVKCHIIFIFSFISTIRNAARTFVFLHRKLVQINSSDLNVHTWRALLYKSLFVIIYIIYTSFSSRIPL